MKSNVMHTNHIKSCNGMVWYDFLVNDSMKIQNMIKALSRRQCLPDKTTIKKKKSFVQNYSK